MEIIEMTSHEPAVSISALIVEGTQKSVYSETLQRKSFLADTSLQQTLFWGTDEMMLKLS